MQSLFLSSGVEVKLVKTFENMLHNLREINKSTDINIKEKKFP